MIIKKKYWYEVDRLSPQQEADGVALGTLRQAEAMRMGLKDKHGFEHGTKSPLEVHILGARGEIAPCLVLGIPWVPTVNTFKAPDLALLSIQVKTRGRHDYDLLVREDDDSDHIFQLVTHSDKNPNDPSFHVHGWMYGWEAKQRRESKHNYGGREWAWFVPQSQLHPIEELIEKIDLTKSVT